MTDRHSEHHRAGRLTRANARAALGIFLVAFLALAVFRSGNLVSYAYDLPPGPMKEAVARGAETWDGWMEAAGAAGLTRAVVDAVDRAVHVRFGDDGEPDDGVVGEGYVDDALPDEAYSERDGSGDTPARDASTLEEDQQ